MKHSSRRRSLIIQPKLMMALFALALVSGAGAGAHRLFAGRQPPAAVALANSPAAQAGASSHRNLSLNPEAGALGRRLGRRFRSAGRELSVAVGTVAAGGAVRQIRVKRVQDAGGEQVEVALGDGPSRVAWDAL